MLGAGAVGMALAVFIAVSYSASGNARFCASCHSMEHVSARLLLSNHKQFACIECHLPNASLPRQVAYKAQAGLNDLAVIRPVELRLLTPAHLKVVPAQKLHWLA